MAIEDTVGHQLAIEASLEAYSKGELVRMLSNVLKTYVIDGTKPLKPEVGRIHVPTHLRELDFPSLIETLKFHLDLPDLEKLNVVDGQVYVMLGDREYALDGSAPSSSRPPAAAPAPPAPSARPAPPTPPPAPAAPPSSPSRPRQNRGGGVFGGGSAPPRENIPMAPPRAEKKKDDKPTEADDRFRMLELD